MKKWVAISLFLISCTAKSSPLCAALFSPLWITETPDVNIVEIRPEQFQKAGVIHIILTPEIKNLLYKEQQKLEQVQPTFEQWDFPRFSALRGSLNEISDAVSNYLLQQLRTVLSDYDWEYEDNSTGGKPQGKIPDGARTSMIHPLKYIEEWHRDTYNKDSEAAFNKQQFDDFILRVTIALPLMDVPSTLVKPAGGLYFNQAIQSPQGYAVGFLRDIIWHTTPQFEQDFRYLYIFDFRGIKKQSN
jgi:hypothetical protein